MIVTERLINAVVLLQPSCSHYGSQSGDKIISAARQSCAYIMCQCYWSYFMVLKPAPSTCHSPKNDGFDSRSLRTIKWIHWQDHVTNAVLCEWAQEPWASVCIAKCRLHWFGHLLCFPSDHPTQVIYHFDPLAASWRRPRGAPTLTGLMLFSITWNGLVWIPVK